jgi:hypothetical protein
MHGYGVIWSYRAKWNAAVQVLASQVYHIASTSTLEVRGRLLVSEHTSELEMDRASSVLRNKVPSRIWWLYIPFDRGLEAPQ